METLYADLAAFVEQHGRCGTLLGDATEPTDRGYLLAVSCSCGVTFLRWVTFQDAVDDLVWSPLFVTST